MSDFIDDVFDEDEYDDYEEDQFEYWREADQIGTFAEILIDLDLLSNKEWYDIDNTEMEDAISNYMFNQPLSGPRIV